MHVHRWKGEIVNDSDFESVREALPFAARNKGWEGSKPTRHERERIATKDAQEDGDKAARTEGAS